MLDLLIIPIFALHLVCVNLAAGGPLVALAVSWGDANAEAPAGAAGRWLAGVSLAGLVVGGTLGVLLGALVWSPTTAADLWRRLDSRATFGVAEIAFSLALHAGYWAWWQWGPLTESWQRWLHRALAALSTTNLLYHFPPLFAIAGRIARGELAGHEPLASPQFRGLLIEGSVLSQTVHFLLASIAVAGVALLFWSSQRRSGEPAAESSAASPDEALARQGAWIAFIPTALQLAVGMWVLFTLPAEVQQRLMGGDLLLTGVFLLSLAVAVWLLHELFAATTSDAPTEHARASLLLLAAVILLMTATLHLSHTGAR